MIFVTREHYLGGLNRLHLEQLGELMGQVAIGVPKCDLGRLDDGIVIGARPGAGDAVIENTVLVSTTNGQMMYFLCRCRELKWDYPRNDAPVSVTWCSGGRPCWLTAPRIRPHIVTG